MIDLDTALGIRHRVNMDCVLTPFESQLVSLEGYSLESGLTWALEKVEVPKLIILPYGLADVLMRHEHYKLMDNEEVFFKMTRTGESTWGYIGTYQEVDVAACATTNMAWITSEADPDFINGGNTVFLTVFLA